MAKDWLRTERLARIAQNERFCAALPGYEGVLNLGRSEMRTVIRDLQWSSYYLRYEAWLEKDLDLARLRARAKHESTFAVPPLPPNVLPLPPSGVFGEDPSIPLTPEPEPGIDWRFRALVRTIKAAKNYSSEIGADLDILAPVNGVPDPATAQPKLKVRSLPGGTIQMTVRPMNFHSVMFQCRVAGALSFLTIAKSSSGKLRWNAPGPFPRELEVRACFEDGEQPVGVPCPIVPVTASP